MTQSEIIRSLYFEAGFPLIFSDNNCSRFDATKPETLHFESCGVSYGVNNTDWLFMDWQSFHNLLRKNEWTLKGWGIYRQGVASDTKDLTTYIKSIWIGGFVPLDTANAVIHQDKIENNLGFCRYFKKILGFGAMNMKEFFELMDNKFLIAVAIASYRARTGLIY